MFNCKDISTIIKPRPPTLGTIYPMNLMDLPNEIHIVYARIGGEVPKRGIHVDPPAPWQFQPAVIHGWETPISWILHGFYMEDSRFFLFMESNDCVF